MFTMSGPTVSVSDACGVKLAIKTPKVQRAARRSIVKRTIVRSAQSRTLVATKGNRQVGAKSEADRAPLRAGQGSAAAKAKKPRLVARKATPAPKRAVTPEPAITAGTATARPEPVKKAPVVAKVTKPAVKKAPIVAETPAKVAGIAPASARLFFATGSASTQSKRTQRGLAAYLKANPSVSVRVVGYTDSVGGEENNLALSQRRAEAALRGLVRMGVPKSQLTAVGRGEESPVADNESASGRAKNRRVEFEAQ